MRQIRLINIWKRLPEMGSFLWSTTIFILVLFLYVGRALLSRLVNSKWIGFLLRLMRFDMLIRLLDRVMKLVDFDTKNNISRGYLIELAFRNMKTKKNRTVVTIGGVALGVGAIVFLVSMGYGLERMVISKVTRLEELKMIDVSKAGTNEVRMDEEVIKRVKTIKGTVDVVPVISLVAKVRYKNSIIDLMSVAVDERYLKASNVKMVAGTDFKDRDNDYFFDNNGEVKGISDEVVPASFGEKVRLGLTRVNIPLDKTVTLWEKCDRGSEMLGLVARSVGGYVAEEIWGERYFFGANEVVGEEVESGKQLSKWYRVRVPLWKVDEDENLVAMFNNYGKRMWETGYLMGGEVVVESDEWLENSANGLDEYLVAVSVLGETDTATMSADLFEVIVATDSAGTEWVELKKKGEVVEEQKNIVYFGQPAAEAYISTGMLKLFGLTKEKVVGEKFRVMYIVSESLLPGSSGSLLSEEMEYTVKGVTDDEASNYYYFQIADAKRLGIKDYSQLKVLVDSEAAVAGVRKEIEVMGFKTTSTLDTVSQIEGLFKTLRFLLGLLGTVGLVVASLGMFNTMTVSLLERTREVGVMKAMGMLSREVRELFLAESMIMGLGGGFAGVALGLLLGRLLSLGLSMISVVRGQGMINISFVPWFFIVFIVSISFVVGMVTGWYPSKRARMISALNALRYE